MKNRVSIKRLAAMLLAFLMVLQTAPIQAIGEDLKDFSAVTSKPVEGGEYARVTFLAPDGEELTEVAVRTVEVGAALGELPEAPEREDYIFDSWKAGDDSVTSETIAENDMEIVATYRSAYPAFTARYEDDSLSLSISAPEGAFPEGVYPSLESVSLSDEQRSAVFAAVDSTGERELEVLDAIDISFLDKDGNKYQPENGKKVSISMNLKEKPAGSVSVVHLPDAPVLKKMSLRMAAPLSKGGSTVNTASTTSNTAASSSQGEVVAQNITDSEFTFDAGSFSVYAVVGIEILSGGEQEFEMTDGDITVQIKTPADAFDPGTEMVVRKITDPETLIKMASALDQSKIYSIKAVDISFYHDGREVEPRKAVSVKLITDLGHASEYKIVHLKDNGTTEVINNAEVDAGGAEFELDSFSPVGAAAIEQNKVPKEGFVIYYGAQSQGMPAEDLDPGIPSAIAPRFPNYVFTNATIGGDSTHSGTEVIYVGCFISEGTTYIYYRTVTDTNDLIVHVESGEHIALNYHPADNYYNINYQVTGNISEISGDPLDYVFGADRVVRAEKYTSVGYTVKIPRGYFATITRNNGSVGNLGTEPTYSVSNDNKIITKNGELVLEGTYEIPSTSDNQNIVVTLTKRTSYTFDASKFLSTVYTGGNSTTMGDSTVNTNSDARITGDGTLGRSGSSNKGKKTFTGNEVSWSFTTNNTQNSHWLMDALQINGTDINVPYGESGPVSKATELPSGAVVTVTLNSVTGSGRNARRNYTIRVTNVYEDVVISGGNIYNADNSTEIISEVLTNVDYSFWGFSSSDNADSSSVRPAWISWGEGEPIAVGTGYLADSGTYDMYRFGQNNNQAMRFQVKPGYINPELALVNSTEGDLNRYITLGSGLSFGTMSDSNGKYYPINGNPDNKGYYYFQITGIGNNNKLALLRIRATLALYGVTYSAGTYNGTAITPAAGTLPVTDNGGYNVKNNAQFVLSGLIPIDNSNQYIFTHWTIQGSNTVYAPGQTVNILDVYQYATEVGGQLYIPFVAHWVQKEQAVQVNYQIQFYIEGNESPEFSYNMQAPKDSAIYVNRDSERIAKVIELYNGLLEYDEEHSAQFVDHVQEGSVVKLRFKWVRFPVTVKKAVESISATDMAKEFNFTASANRSYQIHAYDPVSGIIDNTQNVTRTDSMAFSNFTLQHQGSNILKENGLDVTKGSCINLTETDGDGFAVSYLVTTYESDGTTVKEEKTLTKSELDAYKIEQKTDITVINAKGKINVNKTVRAGDGGTIKQEDINTTIYFALKKQGENDFVRDSSGNIYVHAIHVTNGVADADYVTFTGIEDGTYDVLECRDASGTKLNVGDVFEANGKRFQLSRIQGQSATGANNNAIITGNNTANVSFINTYTDVNENIKFIANKKWMNRQAQVISAPSGAEAVFGVYKQENGQHVPVQIEIDGEKVNYTITLDGRPDNDGETSAWTAEFVNLPKLDSEGKTIQYEFREISAKPDGFYPYRSQTQNGSPMGDSEYETKNGGTIWNRDLRMTVQLQKHFDFQPNSGVGALTYEQFMYDTETQKLLKFTLTTPSGQTLNYDLSDFSCPNNTLFVLDLPNMAPGTYTLAESGQENLLDKYHYYLETVVPATAAETKTFSIDGSTQSPLGEIRIQNKYRQGKTIEKGEKIIAGDLKNNEYQTAAGKLRTINLIIKNSDNKYFVRNYDRATWNATTQTMETAEWTTDISQAAKIKLENLNYNWNGGVYKAESNLGTKISLFPGTYELIEVEATNGTADMPGYNLTVNGTLTIPESYNATVLFSITNTYTWIPMRNLTVKKTVTGNGADTDKEFTFTLNVQDAVATDAYGYTKGTVTGTIGNGGTFKLKHNETITITLPVSKLITLTESDNTDYTVSWSGATADASNANRATLTLADSDVNVEATNSRDTGTLVINKTVTGHPNGKFPYKVKIRNSENKWLKQDLTLSSSADDAYEFEISREGTSLNGKLSLEGVPTGSYTVIEQGTGENDPNTAWIDNYTLETEANGSLFSGTGNVTKTTNGTVNLENKYTRKAGNLTISKKVVDARGTDSNNLPFSFAVELSEDVLADRYQVEPSGINVKKTADTTTGKVTLSFQLKHNESVTLKGLPVGATYSVTETADADFSTSVTSGDASGTVSTAGAVEFTNTRKLGTLTIEKKVVDEAGHDLASTAAYEIDVKKDGESYQKVTITGAGSVTLNNVPRGEYTFVETAPAAGGITGYIFNAIDYGTTTKVTIENAADSGRLTVTNKYIKLIDVTVTKIWDDQNDKYGLRPATTNELVLTLQRNDVDQTNTATVTIDTEDSNKWHYTWSNLPKTDADGNVYTYKAAEKAVPTGYSVSGSPAAADGEITNTLDVHNLVVNKTVTIEPTSAAEGKSYTFTVKNKNKDQWLKITDGVVSVSGTEVTNTIQVSNGSGSVTFQNVPAGEYVVTEQGTAEGGTAWIDNYTLEIEANGSTFSGTGTVTKEADDTVDLVNKYTRKMASVYLVKKVSGNMGDRSAVFHFTVTVKDGETPITIAGVTGADITRIHGQTSTLLGSFPVGSSVTITENLNDEEGYTTTVSGIADPTKTITFKVKEGDQTVTFENKKEVIVDTGVPMESKPYWLLLGLIPLAGVGTILMAKKRRRDEA